MTQKHTQEPWALDDELGHTAFILNANGVAFASMGAIDSNPNGVADARRIVACVNACQGMEDPAALIAGLRSELQLATHKLLTCGVAARHPDASLSRRESDYGGKWNSPQAESVRQLRQQRDELLEALEEAKSVLASINSGNQHKVEVEDDEPAYWQRNEWVAWAKGEVLPMVEAVITKAKGAAAITKITGETK